VSLSSRPNGSPSKPSPTKKVVNNPPELNLPSVPTKAWGDEKRSMSKEEGDSGNAVVKAEAAPPILGNSTSSVDILQAADHSVLAKNPPADDLYTIDAKGWKPPGVVPADDRNIIDANGWKISVHPPAHHNDQQRDLDECGTLPVHHSQTANVDPEPASEPHSSNSQMVMTDWQVASDGEASALNTPSGGNPPSGLAGALDLQVSSLGGTPPAPEFREGVTQKQSEAVEKLVWDVGGVGGDVSAEVGKGSFKRSQENGCGSLRGSDPVKVSPLDLRFAKHGDEPGEVKLKVESGGMGGGRWEWSNGGKVEGQVGQVGHEMEVDVKDLGSRMDVGPTGLNTCDADGWVDKQVCGLPSTVGRRIDP
jgi:hypothetical protein